MGGSLETGKGGGDDLFARKVFSLSGRGGGEVSKQDGGRIGRECGVGSGGVECVFFVWEGLGGRRADRVYQLVQWTNRDPSLTHSTKVMNRTVTSTSFLTPLCNLSLPSPLVGFLLR